MFKGITINGIPVIISDKLIHLIKIERDKDGLVISKHWKKEATLWIDPRLGLATYYCHPDEYEPLVNKVRRN